MEGDEPLQTTMTNFKAFQSTPSAWRETAHSAVVGLGIQKFQSTPSAWRETSHVFPELTAKEITIHSRRMEGDFLRFFVRIVLRISIHSLRMEGDAGTAAADYQHAISIHSLRMEGDRTRRRAGGRAGHFNPLPPHGGRRQCTAADHQCDSISIHSLRMEGDAR